MAIPSRRALIGIVSILICALVRPSTATPNAAFPFNSQVPTVARADSEYSFQISDSTFAPTSSDFTYSLSSQPAWLSIDSASRTLMGRPGQGDVGSISFMLTAADSTGAAHMQCTLVVSSDLAPQLSGDISKQLAATANLSSSNPPVVTLLPATVFSFDFEQESFIDIVQRKLYYYATLSDHTPLPSWMNFDTNTLTFSGTAPDLSAFPQSWDIQLIASDVPGFAAATASFTIAIGTEQLAFVPEEQDLNVTAGRHINFTSLQTQLFRNNLLLSAQELKSANASALPDWLSFDPSTLVVEGTAPEDVEEQNFTVTVIDNLDNTASAVVNLIPGNASLFDGQVGTVVAEAGKPFTYHFEDSMFSEPDMDLSVTLPSNAQWLRFDSATRELAGDVPTSVDAATVKATLTAKPSGGEEGQSQVFTIDVKAMATTATSSSSTRLATRASPTHSSTATPGTGLAAQREEPRLSGGKIAAIVIFSLIGAALLVAGLIWCCRRRRRRGGYVKQSPASSKKTISRPIPPPPGSDTITVTTELQRDVEKTAGSDVDPEERQPPRQVEPPPQITLNLPSPAPAAEKRRSIWPKRFSRQSHASSIGVGEDAIRADSNIPELGRDAQGLHTPHDSFSIPTEMARVSRHLSDNSPSKRALRRLRERHRSRDSIGLGITSVATGGIARHSSKRIGKHRRGRSSFGGLSTTREASSMASLSTRGTSVLSTRASEFPLPPDSTHTASVSLPTLSILDIDSLKDPKRKSIRLVDRSDSVADNRPLADKRSSYIRNRAISMRDKSRASVQSPLFAHGSRASSGHLRQASGNPSSNGGSVRRTRRSKNAKSMLTTYSESSSLEPQPSDPRRSNTRESKRLSQRVKSTFGPNFPRVMTRSTMYADDERTTARDSSSNFTTTSESMNSADWIQDLPKPRHERSWVLPGEASPTPPPMAPSSRQQSASKQGTSTADAGAPKQAWKDRIQDKSSSPLSTNVHVIEPSPASTSAARPLSHARRSNRLSEPISLVSADSMHKGRPRMAYTKSRRPVSVEEVQRLSSMRAEQDEATTAGSEQWDDIDTEGELEGTGLRSKSVSPSKVGTQRSDMSGPAFL